MPDEVPFRTHLSPADERRFRVWYRQWAERAGIDQDPDNPLHHYDARGAFKAGLEPKLDKQDGRYHWPSQFKDDDHPNRFINGVDTKRSQPEGSAAPDESPSQDSPLGDERPDPGYGGDIGKARRAVEARELKVGQDGYWAAVFTELRPDLAPTSAPSPTDRPRLIPLRQYLLQMLRGQSMAPGARAPGNMAVVPPALMAPQGMGGRVPPNATAPPSVPEEPPRPDHPDTLPVPSPSLASIRPEEFAALLDRAHA